MRFFNVEIKFVSLLGQSKNGYVLVLQFPNCQSQIPVNSMFLLVHFLVMYKNPIFFLKNKIFMYLMNITGEL